MLEIAPARRLGLPDIANLLQIARIREPVDRRAFGRGSGVIVDEGAELATDEARQVGLGETGRSHEGRLTTMSTVSVFGSNTICASPRSSWRRTSATFRSNGTSRSP